jgi:flagellar motor switch protein FliN/FliY
VSAQTEQSYTWLRKIPGELFALDEKPLLGSAPDFPWDKFSEQLNRSLQTTDIVISPGELQWRTSTELFAGLGDRLTGSCFSVGPLAGNVWWLMPEQSVMRFMELLLIKQPDHSLETTVDNDFIKASCQFLAIEAISAFDKVDFDKKLTPLMMRSTDLPNESCLCLDISIVFKGETIYGRLCLSSMFRKAWMQRYLQKDKSLSALPMADSLDVVIHLEAGKIDIMPSEWQQLKVGDYVLLDSCSFEPEEDKGRVMLVINGIPCFRGKIKQGSLKILEHPLYHEVDKAMTIPPKKDESHDEDENFDEDFDDLDLDAEESEIESDVTDDTEDFDLDIEDEDDESGIEKAAPIPEKKKVAEKPVAKPAVPPKEVKPALPPKVALSLEDIPMPVVIEVGRIQMSVKKLLELQPGNMLELDIHPESSVDMVVNGKRIARGELLRIGDVLGIRIMELS